MAPGEGTDDQNSLKYVIIRVLRNSMWHEFDSVLGIEALNKGGKRKFLKLNENAMGEGV